MDTPYDEGKFARACELPMDANPYQSGTKRFDDWKNGWLDQAERKLTIYGDWRDLSRALEKAIPGFYQLNEEDRKDLWDKSQAVIDNYAPMKARCLGCGEIMRARQAYRCADCHAHFCQDCIRPHFEGK